MKLPDDQERLKGLLQETITLLCKNGLNYKAEFSVEALIVVTLDQEQMFHANIKETVAKDGTNISLELEESPPKPRKSAKKRRGHRDDSPEIPQKKSNSQHSNPDEEYDEDEENTNRNPKADDENSSECVIVKDEHRSGGPVPLSDLEYVDQSGEHYSQQQHGVWSATGSGEQGEISGLDASGDGSQQEEVADRNQPGASGSKQPVRKSTDQIEDAASTIVAVEEDGTVKIDTRGSVMHFAAAEASANRGVVKRGEKWFTSKNAPPAKSIKSTPIVMKQQIQSPKGRPSVAIMGLEQDEIGEQPEIIPREGDGEYFALQPELVSVVPAGVKSEKKEGNLKGIIKQAVNKVRQEIVTTPGKTSDGGKKSGAIISGAPTPPPTKRRGRTRAPSPEIKVPRGRPVNPAVTSLPMSDSDSLESPVPVVAMDSPSVVCLTTRRQPIKVLGLDKDGGKRPKPEVCGRCGLAFTSLESLSDHQCGEKNLFRCGICDAMFMRKENLKKHFILHRDDVQVEVLESK